MKKNQSHTPIAQWTGNDRIGDQVLSSCTAILRSGGCSWNRCLMCQYRQERYLGLSPAELEDAMNCQLTVLSDMVQEHNPDLVKIYTSGSFFDEVEVPNGVRESVASLCRGRLLTVECRAEYIQPHLIEPYVTLLQDGEGNGGLIVAIGLETSSDTIREKCIDKGISFAQYVTATKIIRAVKGRVKTYLLHKPAYLTEREAYEDMVQTINDIQPYTDIISMNPCAVQRQTFVERLWKNGSYRPPYLWSVLKIIAESPVFITCDALGGGKSRGAHNCGKCDPVLLDAIRDYNENGDIELIKSALEMDCTCKKEWEFVMAHEEPCATPLTR
ncbi:MAG TPA: archaeosine biosynthesis radical SAM protein RaSEA [Methanospirillum sp.]|nr:archaeosine biosynthesis radical SAM protein RaSEA [Methanospirillum sp.]